MEKLLTEAGLKLITVDIEFKATLEKHLHEHEELCETCNGTGMTVDKNIFGIKGIKSKSLFPFKNESLRFCPSCYNGVRKRCEHCNDLIAKGWLTCDCETVRKQKVEQQMLKREERWNVVPKISLENALANYGMLYVDDFEEYVASDSFDDWIEYKQEDEESFNPSDLHIYVTTEHSISLLASDIVENALEDLHEEAEVSNKDMEQLQNYLDEWCDKNSKGTKTYYADFRTGVIYSK